MNGIAFTFCLLCGLDQCEVEELVLRACVERTIPRKCWAKDVKAEIKKQKAPDPDLLLSNYLCMGWYEEHVNKRLRWQFNSAAWETWEFEEQLWWATRGEFGDAPPPWKRVILNELVLKIGKSLPAAIRKGVPVKPWVEKIGRPK